MLAGEWPRDFKERGSAGAKRPPSWVTVRRPFGARVRWLSVPRVRSHRQRAFGPTPWRATPGLRIRTVGGCAPQRNDAERRCATGVRAVRCRSCTASSPRPRHLRRASPRGRRMIAKPACLNRAPALPRVRRSADASLVTGRDGRSMGAGGEDGDKTPLSDPKQTVAQGGASKAHQVIRSLWRSRSRPPAWSAQCNFCPNVSPHKAHHRPA